MEEKRVVRASVRAGRAAKLARAGEAARLTAGLTERLAELTLALRATRVSCFVSVGGEPDTSGYLKWAYEHGVEVLLPRVLPNGELEWAAHSPGALAPGAFGIPEPMGEASEAGATSRTELMLVPAAAVDRVGTRLGWGRGYFDRELARLRVRGDGDGGGNGGGPAVFAVVHEDEVLAHIPAEAHDVPVDGAVTEERIHSFG